MGEVLVIVESPAKARKIAGLLGSGYQVRASLGHVRDLPASKGEIPERYRAEPWANLGVDPASFRPIYVVPPGKRQTVADLRARAASADRVLFASDADREGEAISWHLSVLLGVKDPQRLVFTEITKPALLTALTRVRPLDLALVAAQESRRVIDRLCGYTVSPLLWGAVGRGLSAGRVQSAALGLLIARETARMAFVPVAFWTIRAEVGSAPPFLATVTHMRTRARPEGAPLARASDFTAQGAEKEPGRTLQLSAAQARELTAYLNRDGVQAEVTAVTESETRSRPAPPFTTSTLQQAGARLKLGASEVMASAQRLYEAGLITYMRTDSSHLADEALTEARRLVKKLFGNAALPPTPRQYAARDANAQEAHEAIRPAGHPWTDPAAAPVSGADLAVYTLIWKRTLASQMRDAVYDRTAVTLRAGHATLAAVGRVQREAGFTALLTLDEPDRDDQTLPPLAVGETYPVTARPPEGKTTSAPPRYTEASLVAEMERAGIGRPSTYAQTLATLQRRGYTRPQGRALAVSATGLLVGAYLSAQVPQVMQAGFTAEMEAGLDRVARGELRRLEYLALAWTDGLEPATRAARRQAPSLALPHLPGVTLRATPAGPVIDAPGGRAALPDAAVPADLHDRDLARLIAGTWAPSTEKRPRKERAGQTKPAGRSRAGEGRGAPSKARASKPKKPRKARVT